MLCRKMAVLRLMTVRVEFFRHPLLIQLPRLDVNIVVKIDPRLSDLVGVSGFTIFQPNVIGTTVFEVYFGLFHVLTLHLEEKTTY